MADVTEKSLDDFFAKRDKKKKKESKGKGGKEAPQSAAPQSAAMKMKMKEKKEKSFKTGENQDGAQIEKEDEEWKEFEQKEVDYSGLRLQALQITDEREESDYEKEELDEHGDIILVSGNKESGPWNKSNAGPAAAPAPVEEEEVPESKPAGVYRPPGARLTTTKRGPAQGPPEINSDTQFPSLSSSSKHVETRKDREMERTFEVVKHKTRGREEGGTGGGSTATNQQLQLDNQYACLGDK